MVSVVVVVGPEVGNAGGVDPIASKKCASDRQARHATKQILERQSVAQSGSNVGRLGEILSTGHVTDDGAIRIAVAPFNYEFRSGSERGGNIVLMPRRTSSSSSQSRNHLTGEKTSRLNRWVGVVKELTVDSQLWAEDVIDLHHILAEVENIAQRPCVSEGIVCGDQIWRREFGEDVLDVSCGNGISGASWDAGAVGLAGAGSAIAVGHWVQTTCLNCSLIIPG